MIITIELSRKMGKKRPRCSVCGKFVGTGGTITETNGRAIARCKRCTGETTINEDDKPRRLKHLEKLFGFVSKLKKKCILCAGTGFNRDDDGVCEYCHGAGIL